jgi:molybdenum cofactor cytidylyltransferase
MPAAAPLQVAALVLAAGSSRRTAPLNKLLLEVEGTPMARRAVETALASRARPVIAVVGHEAQRIRRALAGLEIAFVYNPDHARGLSTSLRAGLAAVGPQASGAVVCLADMPRVTAAHVDRLIDAFERSLGAAVCVPTHAGRRGNPVLWPRRFFAEMAAVEGDIGARHLMRAHAEDVREVAMEDDGILFDVDEP